MGNLSSGNVTTSYSATRVFDGSTSSRYCSWPGLAAEGEDIASPDGFPVDLFIEFVLPIQLTKYAVQAASASVAPTDFLLEASDGSEWRTLDERSGVVWGRDSAIQRFDIEAAV